MSGDGRFRVSYRIRAGDAGEEPLCLVAEGLEVHLGFAVHGAL